MHGQLVKLRRLLAGAGLVDAAGVWTGGAAHLWFLGDFLDRGPAGLACVDLVRRLQTEAAAAGGHVGAILGNHEVLILSAHRFGIRPTAWGGTFQGDWQRNGGRPADLFALTPAHIAWIGALPALAHVRDRLLMHADSPFYATYGDSVATVNAAFATLLAGDDADAFDHVLGEFAERRMFLDSRPDGPARAAAFLEQFGGRQIVHGHTPIPALIRRPPAAVTGPLVYAGGLCVNVDGGMYQGGPGFVFRLAP